VYRILTFRLDKKAQNILFLSVGSVMILYLINLWHLILAVKKENINIISYSKIL